MNQNISPELETEINMIMDLQKKLLFLTEETIESVCNFILESVFIHSSERPRQLTSSLFVAIEYRPWSIPHIARLCYILLESASSTNSLSKLKFDILFTIFNKERVKQENLHFLAHCLEVCFLYPEELVDFIHQFMIEKSDFVKEILEYFAWFAPEIEMTNPVLFDQLYSLYSKQHSNNRHNSISSIEEEEEEANDDDDINNNNPNIDDDDENNKNSEEEINDFEPELDDFFKNFKNLRENNWELLKRYRLNGCNHNLINIAIKNDDADELQRIISEDCIDINSTSRPSIFELSIFCQTDPTFIQIAAFYQSVKCFKYLYSNGADIKRCDEEHKSTIQFAVAGGNHEIIRILQRANIDFSGAANIATLYHRNDIFNWIHDTIENNLQFVDKYHGTLLQSSCGSNNLEIFSFCMKHGADVNQKDDTGVCIFFFLFLVDSSLLGYLE